MGIPVPRSLSVFILSNHLNVLSTHAYTARGTLFLSVHGHVPVVYFQLPVAQIGYKWRIAASSFF
jgi:hypothetical protein